MTDQRVPITIKRHTTTRLVGLRGWAVVDNELAAWTNPITQQPEVLRAGAWQRAGG